MPLFNFKSSTLFWPGCFTSSKHKKQILRYKKILRKLNISFTTIEDIICCSGILINAGYEKQARRLARENFEKLKDSGIRKIITSCPLCYKTLSQNYPEMIPDWDIKVENIISTILTSLEKNPKLIKNKFQEKQVAYYDNPYLSRYSEIINQPRDILQSLGIDLLELKNNKKNTTNIGTTGNLLQTNPEIANQLVQNFIKNLPENTKEIITTDSQDYIHLKNNITNPILQLTDFSELVCKALKIKTGILK